MKFGNYLREVFGVITLLLILHTEASMNFSNYLSCYDWCTCRHDNAGKIIVKCKLKETNFTRLQLPPLIDEM